jgi:hypothetical protein
VALSESKRRLLTWLRERKRSCTLEDAEAALRAWGFKLGRAQGHARVWTFRSVVVVMHRPHGKHMDPGAVSMVIRCIERAEVLQEEEAEDAQ